MSERTRGQLLVGGLALLLTLLNALKPVHVDDTTYHAFARQIAKRPLDPYGFALLYFNQALPANHVLAPPVFGYWFGAGVALFAERPLLWKLWLFPFALVLVAALWALARRFAPGLERPLILLAVLSPTIVPGFNLMTDVPCLALGLAALALFVSACDRRPWGRAALAGVVAGLAMQTKYTALLVPAVMLAYAALERGLPRWLVAAAVAGLLFASWEAFIAWRYGESHFLYHLRNQAGQVSGRIQLVAPLLVLLGYTAPTVLLLFGLTAWKVGVAALRPAGRDGWFLVLWIALEVAGYFALTPYAAARRVMALVIAGTLLGGHLAACGGPGVTRAVRWLAAVGVLLGLVYYAVDLREAQAEQEGVDTAARWIREQDPEARIWYMGYWGFQYYAERAGMRQVAPWHGNEDWREYVPPGIFAVERSPRTLAPALANQALCAGDWLVFPEKDVPQQLIFLNPEEVALLHRVEARDRLPLRTLPGYYNGGGLPLRWSDGPRCAAVIARVRRDFHPIAR